MVDRLAAAFLTVCLAHQADAAKVWLMEIEGAIGPASADHFIRALDDAEEAQVDLLVVRLDTPGGLDKSMRDMIKALLASNTPVATYVAPNGARAASAGTYIMYASHIAAMAPATNIGSSTPVSIGGGSPLPLPGRTEPEGDEPEPEPAGDDGVDLVDGVRVRREARARRIDVARHGVAARLQLAAQRRLRERPLGGGVPVLDAHSPACSFT
jgi:membrane-bound serine protease (ClpP class)